MAQQASVCITCWPTPSPSLLGMLDNSRDVLSKATLLSTCICSDPAFDLLPELEGHVCCTLAPVLNHDVHPWPAHWHSRSRFLPEPWYAAHDIRQQLDNEQANFVRTSSLGTGLGDAIHAACARVRSLYMGTPSCVKVTGWGVTCRAWFAYRSTEPRATWQCCAPRNTIRHLEDFWLAYSAKR